MKKSLSFKIIAVFSFVLLLSITICSVIIYTYSNSLYQKENYDRLTLYLSSLPSNMENYIEENSYTDIGVIYELKNEIYYNNIAKKYKVNPEEFLENLNLNNLPKTGFIKLNQKYYYVGIIKNNQKIVVFTNSDYINSLQKKILLPTIFTFLIVFILGIYILFYWSNKFVLRLKNIKQNVVGKEVSKEILKNYPDDEIKDLGIEIINMQEKLFKNEETKKEMLQNVSHDFKTPIAVIKSYAEAVLDGVEEKDGLNIIIKQANLLENKVKKLLEITKLEYISDKKDFSNINLKPIINDVIINYKHQTNIKFILELEDIYFVGYKDNYYSIINNIIENGIRYAKTYIKIILKDNCLSIKNDGKMIEEEFLNNIFTPYEKGNNGKFGLGMTIVKRSLDFFGYDIKINQDLTGVEFIIKRKEDFNE